MTKSPHSRPPTPDVPQRVEGLLERLRAATGPDRVLDALIHFPDVTMPCRLSNDVGGNASVYWNEGKLGRSGYIPAYTASLDAALVLVERVLPGWGFSISGFTYTATKTAVIWTEGKPQHSAQAPTAPLAVLIALLSALTPRNQE